MRMANRESDVWNRFYEYWAPSPELKHLHGIMRLHFHPLSNPSMQCHSAVARLLLDFPRPQHPSPPCIARKRPCQSRL